VLDSDDLAAAALTAHEVEMLRANHPISASRHTTMIRGPEDKLIHIFGQFARMT
jgi:hypothetical protein